MADHADQAQSVTELLTSKHIENIRRQSTQTLPTRGACYFCDEPLTEGLFCDADCSQDYEKEQRVKRNRIA